jgi:magnesium-transporting ATPase (P-type)
MDTLDNETFTVPGGSPDIDKELSTTHPWMRLTAITQVCALLISLISNIYIAAVSPYDIGFRLGSAAIGILIIIFPVIFLFQSSAAFRDYVATHNQASLLLAFKKQKAFWRYIGILVIIYLVIILLALLYVMVSGGGRSFGF